MTSPSHSPEKTGSTLSRSPSTLPRITSRFSMTSSRKSISGVRTSPNTWTGSTELAPNSA